MRKFLLWQASLLESYSISPPTYNSLTNIMDKIINFYNKVPSYVRELFITVIIFVSAFIINKVVIPKIKLILQYIAEKSGEKLEHKEYKRICNPLRIILFSFAFVSIFNILTFIPAKAIKTINNISFVIIVFSFGYLFINFIKFIFLVFANKLNRESNRAIDEGFISIFNTILSLIVFVIVLSIILGHFNINISSLLATLGVGSLAIALAAKDTLSNMISGFMILIDRPFRIGDRLILDDDLIGDVTHIGLRSTKIVTLDRRTVILPNAKIANEQITNLSYPDNIIYIKTKIGVGYGSDIDLVKQKIREAISEIEDISSYPKPIISFEEFASSSLNFMIWFAIRDYRNQFAVQDKFHSLLNKKFREAGINIPFPIITIDMPENKG